MNKKIISSVAIDLGATDTGVYYAHYQEDELIQNIKKEGRVYSLEKDHYTYLLKDRTIKRHLKRCNQRRKLAKRLMEIVLKKQFDFPSEKHKEAIAFFLNRRGFSFLTTNYKESYIDSLKDDVPEVHKKLKKILETEKDISMEWLNSTIENGDVKECLEKIQNSEEYKKIKKLKYHNLVIVNISKYINDNKTKDKIKNSLTKVKKENYEALGIKDFTSEYPNLENSNIVEIIDTLNEEKKKEFQEKAKNIKKGNTKKINESIWGDFKGKFELEKNEEKFLLENNTEKEKIYLRHFYFALYKINEELQTGSRHRKKYFTEIKNDLDEIKKIDFSEKKIRYPRYFEFFVKAINENKKIDFNKFYNIICHISNLELKPLRKYFNNKKFIKEPDYYDNQKLTKIITKWFLKQWRNQSNIEKTNFNKLKKEWDEYKKKEKNVNIVDFFQGARPVLTIPPYQNNNNKDIPKCQSLIFNEDYLNKNYPDWQGWLKELRITDSEKYEEKLKEIKSRKNKNLIEDKQVKLRLL